VRASDTSGQIKKEKQMPNLDGTETIKPTPFDTHEQIVRGPHAFDKEQGYVKTDPVHTFNEKDEPMALHEYPKAIAHNEDNTEPIVAKDAAHEAELIEQLEAAEDAAKKEEK